MSEPAASAPAETEAARLTMTPEVAAFALDFLGRAALPVMLGEAEKLLLVRATLQAIAGRR